MSVTVTICNAICTIQWMVVGRHGLTGNSAANHVALATNRDHVTALVRLLRMVVECVLVIMLKQCDAMVVLVLVIYYTGL